MKIITGVLIAIIVALVVCFIPLKEAAYTVIEPLDYQEQSYVKRGDSSDLRRAILSTVAFSKDIEEIQEALRIAYSFAEYYPIGSVAIRNTDKIQGTFEVEITFQSGDDQYTEKFTLELKPGQIEEVSMSASGIHYEKDKWSWEYEVTPDTKRVTRYKRVTLLDYLLHY